MKIEIRNELLITCTPLVIMITGILPASPWEDERERESQTGIALAIEFSNSPDQEAARLGETTPAFVFAVVALPFPATDSRLNLLLQSHLMHGLFSLSRSPELQSQLPTVCQDRSLNPVTGTHTPTRIHGARRGSSHLARRVSQ